MSRGHAQRQNTVFYIINSFLSEYIGEEDWLLAQRKLRLPFPYRVFRAESCQKLRFTKTEYYLRGVSPRKPYVRP